MKQNHQFRQMFWVSVGLHAALAGFAFLLHFFYPPLELHSPPENAQIVSLFEPSEMVEPEVPDLPPSEELPPAVQEQLAFQAYSSMQPPPATPTPLPPSTPTLRPTVTPVPTRTPISTPRPRFTTIPRPSPTVTPVPPPTATAMAFDVPRRDAVLQPAPGQPEDLSTLRRGFESVRGTPAPGNESGLSGASIMLDQADEFPFPEYLNHIQEKIGGLWFPQGEGMVSIYLIIDRNGKILKSGVDKGEGFGVEKLRDSVMRAVALVKRFNPLPPEYAGTLLRVRIIVRR